MKALKCILAIIACTFFFSVSYAVRMRPGSGMRLPEYLMPTEHDNPAVWSTQSVPMTKGAAPGEYAIRDVPRTGSIEYILVLVDFTDLKFTIQDTLELKRQYDRYFNEHGYYTPAMYYGDSYYYASTGSVSDYFRDQSYGQYNPTFKVVGPVHPSKSYSYYGSGYNESNLQYLIREVCDSVTAKGIANLNDYVRNGNLDNLCIVYAGRGQNYDGSDVNTIWPSANKLNYNKNGIHEIYYVCVCELFWDSDCILDGIGTFCHEFSHTLGLPDFYSNSTSSDPNSDGPMGYWSLMDMGNYENGGFSPVGMTAFEKYSLGWMDIEELTTPGYYTLHNINHQTDSDAGIHTAYRLNTDKENEFIILENHAKTGWYKHHGAEGLMITSVIYDEYSWNNKMVNTSSPKRYHLIPADNTLDKDSYQGDLFPYQEIDSATTQGTPKLYTGSSSPLYSVYYITRQDSLISFYAGLKKPSGVTGQASQQISIDFTDGRLTVNSPIGTTVTIHDLSGKTVIKTETTLSVQQIELPGPGIWLVRCGNRVKKLRIEK